MQPSNPPNTSGTARLLQGARGLDVGWQQLVQVAAPAAGQQWSYKVDGRYFERLIAVYFTLTTSAVVANRFPLVTVKDNNGVIIATVPAGSTVPATTNLLVSLFIGAPGFAVGTAFNTAGCLPDLILPPDYTWSSSILGGDAGDQFSVVTLLVQRFPNDAAMVPAGEQAR